MNLPFAWAALLPLTAALASQPVSPAERAIAAAEATIARNPQQPDGYNSLAIALSRRARETADIRFYDEANSAVERSLATAPDNFGALRARCWILLGKHEFAKALTLAKELNARMPDDHSVYGFLVDANVELGNYEDAEKAAQWMLDLSRNNIPALTRTAYLRETFGDAEGALELMRAAYERLPPSEVEDRAWVLAQSANLLIAHGRLDEAAAWLAEAQRVFPDYHYTLAALARLETARGNFKEAVALMRRRYELARHPENLFDVAVAMHRSGLYGEARAAFAEFERMALAESEGWDNANRELIALYSDFANQPSKALKIAVREIERRRDIGTIDAYAWALYRAKRYRQAGKEIDKALSVGTTDARVLYHAGVIFRAAGRTRKGDEYLRRSLKINPHSEVAANILKALQ
jgi:tetratricopeptide (TPR) repeat protein